MASEPHSLRPLLSTLGLIGLLGTWGRTALDGTLAHLFRALHGSDAYILPGTNHQLRRSFTGIYWPVDYLLDVLVVFFWEAVDGSHPATSTIGVYFLGQLFPILVAFYMGCFRQGRRQRGLLRSTFWLLAFQACSLGATNFLWALSSIASSPLLSSSLSLTALRNASLLPPQRTLLILPALLLGYWLPAALMSLPSPGVVSNAFQQWAIVAWNLYPLLVYALFRVFAAVVSVASEKRTDAPPAASTRGGHLKAVRLVSGVAILVGFILHIAVLTLAISSSLFPALFNPSHASLLSLSSLFLPPLSIAQGKTVGDGVRGFMLWDQLAGYAVMLLVAVLELRTVVKARKWETNWMKSLGFVVFGCLLIGPGSTYLAIRWAGDEDLFEEGKDEKGVVVGKVK